MIGIRWVPSICDVVTSQGRGNESADNTNYRLTGFAYKGTANAVYAIIKTFAWYLDKEGARMGCDEANALLDARLRKAAFRRDMDTLLRPGLPKFNVDQGAEVVRGAYFRYLRR